MARQFLLRGHVQGIGFRPFVYRLAIRLGLTGWVCNQAGEVFIHAQGSSSQLDAFEQSLFVNAPAAAVMAHKENVPSQQLTQFSIQQSNKRVTGERHIMPDQALCNDCYTELFSTDNRRAHYPFINCTSCGPRYTIIEQLPFDRSSTTMREFALCSSCLAEYKQPSNRRFHAEAICCASCGPTLVYDSQQSALSGAGALTQASEALAAGDIIAVKGIGGYHLMCLADDDQTVLRLRQRKQRPAKPFAVMLSRKLLQHWRDTGIISQPYAAAINHHRHPIVLTPCSQQAPLSQHCAPGLDQLGIMLAYTPLHILLLEQLQRPLIATSANLSGEPVITDNDQAQQRLINIADGFLHHNRTILRQADDPLYSIIDSQTRPLRIGRGNAPYELDSPVTFAEPILALGGHMKNTIALAWDNRIVLSAHHGDLETPYSLQVFEQSIHELQQLYQVTAKHYVCDSHSGYASHRYARDSRLPWQTVPHHHAHAAAVAGEFALDNRWLVFTWDGIGLGADGSLWGGEALLGRPGDWQRAASFRPFRLPGGERCQQQIWRTAYSLCWQCDQHWDRQPPERLNLLHQAWQQSVNSPETTSAGRLFDAAAALLGLLDDTTYDGQAPMLLEACASQSAHTTAITLPHAIDAQGVMRCDWQALLPMLLDQHRPAAERAHCFHHSLAYCLLEQALQLRQRYGQFSVGLTGGVFQNKLLSELSLQLLRDHEFDVYLPARIPLNDAGLCYGQLIESFYQTNHTAEPITGVR